MNDLKHHRHHNNRLQRCFDKYGETAFAIELFEACTPELLDEREQYWIDCHFNNTLCMNSNHIATKPPNRKGRPLSEITKQRIGMANTGHRHSEETKALIGKASLGHKRWLGKKHTDATKQKLSEIKGSSVQKAILAPDGTLVVFSNLSKFCKTHGLDRGAVYRVLSGKAKSHQEWTKP